MYTDAHATPLGPLTRGLVPRLYLVTRSDLPPATQACQLAHAAFDFAVLQPDVVQDWHASSNTLVLLAVADEPALAELYVDAKARGLRAIRFHEPDLGDALTAIALEPAARKLLTRLPLALCITPTRSRERRQRFRRELASGAECRSRGGR